MLRLRRYPHPVIVHGNVVLWVRHAQSLGNVERRLSHRAFDPPLTSLGVAQAVAVADALAARGDLRGRPVLCSPSLRTRQTADLVVRSIGGGQMILDEGLDMLQRMQSNSALQVGPTTATTAGGIPEVGGHYGGREIDCGDLDGRDDQRTWEIVDRLKDRWARGDLDAAYPVGESLRDVLTRMRAALSRAASLTEDGPAVLVGHGGSLGLFASQLLAPHERSAFVRLANASVSEVLLAVRGGELSVRVVTWNGTQHLDAVQ